MQIPGLVTVAPTDTETIQSLSNMMGVSFLEELWTQVWLEALDPFDIGRERKLEISRAVMVCDFTVGTPYECCYMLPDMAAGAGGYLASDLKGRTWAELQAVSFARVTEQYLTDQEAAILLPRAEAMEAITNEDWLVKRAAGGDYIHFFSLGVNPDMRGTGAFRKLFEPFMHYADERGVPCYLECYTDRLEGLYGHFGFETVETFSDPAFPIVQRAMERRPRA